MVKIRKQRFFSRLFLKNVLLRCFVLVFALLPLMLLVGCAGNTSAPTDILSRALDAEMTVSTGDVTYRVTVHLGEQEETEERTNGEENGASARECEIIFLSPASLEGITARNGKDERSVSRGDMTVTLAETAENGLFLAAGLLSSGSVVGSETGKEDGETCLLIRFSDGRVFSVSAASGQILAVRKGDVTAKIEWIEERKGAVE